MPEKLWIFTCAIAVIFVLLSLRLFFNYRPKGKDLLFTYKDVIITSICAFVYMLAVIIVLMVR